MSFGARLRQLRKERSLKQSELAKDLDMTIATISAYENETRTPDIKVAQRIADYFDVTMDNLLGIPSKETIDLGNILKTSNMTLNGKEISDRDKDVIERVLSAVLSDETSE